LETKRLALAFALSAAVLIAWSFVSQKYLPQPKRPAPGATPVASPASATAAATASPTAAPTPAAAAGAAPVPARVAPVAASEAKDIVVSTRLYAARLTNRGGALVSFVLERYTDAAGKPLELVRKGDGFPGSTLALDPADPFLARARDALYTVEQETKAVETRVTFHYREPDGNGILRTYIFRPGYVVSLRVEREGPPRQPVAVVLGPGLGNPSLEERQSRYTKPGSSVVLSPSGSVDIRGKDALKQPLALGSGAVAAGLEDNYFVAAFLPVGEASTTLRPVAIPAADPTQKAQGESEIVLAASGLMTTDLFLGPKELELLDSLRPGMARVIDYGMFTPIVRLLLFLLRGIHAGVGNWGLAIILITVLIKLVLYPLTHKQLVSMKKMSRVQPKMETIRAKWSTKIKTDPQARMKMNEEMMALYKTEGINPAAGCVPLLLQMPILFAFYQLLAHSIELRHAPFALWLTDLSAKDPYYVTPILMTITMWIQQQMTPATGDPAQRRIFAMMPFVMGFLFKDVPSGLVLYWLIQNVLTIAQQMILNKYTDLGPASMKKA
jgi:YidC/Oxa1 family membrane protein insertase